MKHDSLEAYLEGLPPSEPYFVTCDRCGKIVSCDEAVAEEGDEWECFPCNDRENAKALGKIAS